MATDTELRQAVAVMSSVLYRLTASAAVWAEKIPDEALREDAVKTLDECSDVMQRLARSFPPELFPTEYRGILH